jgi:hypothetical protein
MSEGSVMGMGGSSLWIGDWKRAIIVRKYSVCGSRHSIVMLRKVGGISRIIRNLYHHKKTYKEADEKKEEAAGISRRD